MLTTKTPSTRASRLIRLLVLAVLVPLTALVVPSAASAATATTDRTITASSPTYAHPNLPCVTGSSATHYSVIKVKLNTGTGPSTFSVSVTPSGFKANVAVYQSVFQPDAPDANCFEAKNGSASGATVTYSTVLNDVPEFPGIPEQTMFVVVSGVTGSDLGSFSASISATGRNVTLSDTTPAPPADTTPPVITVPDGISREATSASGATVTYDVSATDAKDGTRPVTCAPASGTTFAVGTTDVSCSSTDTAGNTSRKTFTVTVTDSAGPVITVPAEVRKEATSTAGAPVSYEAKAVDAVDGDRPVTCSPESGGTFPIGSTTVSCSSTDARGHTATKTFAVTVGDTRGPVLDVSPPITAEASSASGASVAYAAPEADDAVDGIVPSSCSPASGTTFAIGKTTVTCSAVDTRGNRSTTSFSVEVRDTTAPAVTVPSDIEQEAAGPNGAVVTFGATASDVVDGPTTTSCSPASGSVFDLGRHTVTCSSTDAAGNQGTAAFDVVVGDTSAPVLVLPDDVTAEATGPAGASVTFEATASDLVDAAPSVACTPASGSAFAIGTTTVSCRATDSDFNATTGTFTITVEDTSPPTTTVPDDITAEATGPGGAAVTYDTSALDAVDGDVPTACSPASGATFGLGTTTVTCSAVDDGGNSSSADFDVTVQDTTPPTITGLTDLESEAAGVDGSTVDYTAGATDLVDGDVAPSCTPASGSVFPIGATTVTCTATDAAGNTASDDFSLTVGDTSGPVITAPEGVLTVEATGPDGAHVTFEADATDDVSGEVPVTCTPPPGSTFGIGYTTVICRASDAGAHETTTSFVVHVDDTTPPRITVPDHVTVRASSRRGAVVDYEAKAVDVVSGPVPVDCTPRSGARFGIGRTTVTCTASDPARPGPQRLLLPLPRTVELRRPASDATLPSSSAEFAVTVLPVVAGADDTGPLPDTGAPGTRLHVLLGGVLAVTGAALVVGVSGRRRSRQS